MKDLRKYVAEFIGTFVLVLVACGTAMITSAKGDPTFYLTTAAAFGLVIVAMAYSIGNISGCHINPAVSLAMLVSKKMNVKDFCCYVVAQCLGAILGAVCLGLIFGFDTAKAIGFGANATEKVGGGFLLEVLLTCIFVLAILGVTSREAFSKVAGLVIGGSLTLVHLFGIYFTGTSVNPARSFGPALLLGGESLKVVWVFIVGPLIGGVIAALLWKVLGGAEE